MPVQITIDQLISWVHRLTHFAVWVLFLATHALALSIALSLLFLLDVTGSDIRNYILIAGSHLGIEAAWQALSFFGVSGFALLSAYAIAMKKLLMKFSLRYILKSTADRD